MPVLQQGVGYGVVLGIGFFFSGFMILISYIQARYTAYKPSSSEEFTSASRSVKPGLIASGIVSAWTWAATLLQSSTVAFEYGISGPWWYASGATVQILLFAQNAAKLKLNAPNAHTFLEVIYLRWGAFAHCVFLFFALATNIIVSSMLILGGSATVNSLTGMNTLAACFLIPLGVVVYVIVGGMRATLLCDYTHTTVLFAIILTFMFVVFATSEKIGSPGAMYDLLQEASILNPVPANAQGSYLTMRSKNGLIFGVINVIGNFATVYLDQAYWQRAIASQPVTAVKAFMLGGLAWFAIPFGFATTLGLAAVVLRTDPAFPVLSPEEVSAGLAAPSAAAVILGQSGAITVLVLLFLAVTSAASAEMIAVSSVITYDIYKTYFNPAADEKRILWVSHAGVVFYGVCMGFLGLIFYYINVSMGWLYLFMGTVLGSAVVPTALAIMSSKANKWGCITGCISGFASGLIAWLVTASTLNNGVLNVTTTGESYPMLAGNLASIGVGAIVSTVWTYLRPDNFDFAITRQMKTIKSESQSSSRDDVDKIGTPHGEEKDSSISEKSPHSSKVQPADVEGTAHVVPKTDRNGAGVGADDAALEKAYNWAVKASVIITLIFLIIIPMPLFFSSHVYSKAGYYVWVIVGFIWVFVGSAIVVIYPIYESRDALNTIFRGIIKDVYTGGKGAYVAPAKVEGRGV